MESIGTILQQLLEESQGRQLSDRMQVVAVKLAAARDMTPEERRRADEERARVKCDRYNRTPGHLKDGYFASTFQSEHAFIEGDGYDCKLCMNRGDTLHVRETPTGFYEYAVPCKCMEIRRSIVRLKRSGLEKSIRESTFKRFVVEQPWQQKMLDMAHRYLAEGVKDGRWLYIGGQPGCGKTHICTAVAGKLLYEMPVIYAVWPQISQKLKAIVNEADLYEAEVSELREIDVLYIDDLFKPVPDERTGAKKPPTGPDIRLAFEILNYRYINKKPTILSSEWFINELADIDESTASRISERCGEFAMTIGRDRSRNHRLSMSTVV